MIRLTGEYDPVDRDPEKPSFFEETRVCPCIPCTVLADVSFADA